jgi:hypothetical protein
MEAIIHAHARRLGLTVEQLTAALLQHGARELANWAEAEEAADPGSVWHTGDVPDCLERYLLKREGF